MIKPIAPTSIADVAKEVGEWCRSLEHSVLVSDKRITELVKNCVTGPAHYAKENESGRLLAITTDSLWFERKQASVIYFSGDEALLRDFIAWAEARPVIKAYGCSIELTEAQKQLFTDADFSTFASEFIKYKG